MKKAIIRKVTRGKKAGQFRFKFIGKNGEPVGGSENETYTSLQMCKKTLKNYFPDFEVVQDF